MMFPSRPQQHEEGPLKMKRADHRKSIHILVMGDGKYFNVRLVFHRISKTFLFLRANIVLSF